MIPKKIIFTIVDYIHDEHKSFVESFYKFNPTYEIMFFNNEQQEEFIKTHYFEYYANFLKLPKFIQKSDFFRLAAIHYYGGIYCDIDIECVKPLDNLLDKTLFYVVEEEISLERFKREKQKGRYYGFDYTGSSYMRYGNYAFGAKKNHWFIKTHMDDIMSEIDWIISSEAAVNTEEYEYWIYNTTATDRTSREIYIHQPKDLFTVKYPNQKVTDDDKLLYPLYFGEYGIHWCNGVWKINSDK